MARFVTPQGVEVETSEKAGRSVGFKPAEKPKPAPRKKATGERSKPEPDSDDE